MLPTMLIREFSKCKLMINCDLIFSPKSKSDPGVGHVIGERKKIIIFGECYLSVIMH